MTTYDNSYVNRKALVIDTKNLNSWHSHRVIHFIGKNFVHYATKISKKYKERWSIESKKERLEYPEYKIIPAKTINFTKDTILTM